MSNAMPAPSPDTPITIKIALNNGENRRFKLALRELQANTLPDKLRSLLSVPPAQTVTFERFSDSAGAFIKLESSNPSVYKQLYRAAKAKLKLRIRATITGSPLPVPSTAPPVLSGPDHLTGESYDSPKHYTLSSAAPICQSTYCSAPGAPEQRLAYTYTPTTPTSAAKTDKVLDEATTAEVKKEADDEAPLPRFFSAREQLHAELASMSSNDNKGVPSSIAQSFVAPGTSFTICCNNCNVAIPNVHYHCSKCDDGDYDLCEACYDRQIRCNGDDDDHWLVKRYVKDGKVTSSSTETIKPKTSTTPEIKKEVPGAFTPETKEALCELMDLTRTCNSCVGVFDENNFVTCTVCEDFDLCISCHVGNKHGHHPSHAFMPASEETTLNALASKLLAPGRNVRHAAICDACDKDIYGIRHKCMNCPDWDLCDGCIKSASTSHPGHRFAALYEPISSPSTRQLRHYGIYCDGSLCAGKGYQTYITGDRYKCAVCHDTDFCANCEALPSNGHNRTHPLIKFKTPVRNVSVTTLGEKENGEHSYTVGDQLPATSSKSTETTPAAPSANAATQVQALAEVKPTEEVKPAEPLSPAKAEIAREEASIPTSALQATFLRDAIADGSVLTANTQFEQVWTLRNPGPHAWPAGCSVRFTGGDSMFNVDSNQPLYVIEIEKATESNTIDRVVEVGEEVDFKVVMRTPAREGKAISYWRLKAADGFPFGHKLWCDINVQKAEPQKTVATSEPTPEPEASQSTMIFPKLDKESPVSSAHEAVTAPSEPAATEEDLADEVETLNLDDSETDDGFLTDEEYEMLSASEDEFKEARNGKN